MFDAYTPVFERCGLTFRAVEAGTGTIGGSLSHEFQVLAASGEDAIVSCQRCAYAANVEKAEVRPVPAPGAAGGPLERLATPGKRSVEEVSAFLGLPPARFIKTLLYRTAGGEVVAILVRGDHEASGTKVQAALGGEPVTLADEEAVERATGAPVGFAGPVGLRVRMVADASLRGVRGAIAGANRADEHLVNVDQERDLPALAFADLRQARGGDACPRCEGGAFAEHRGIEVGQVFYLGTKYSEAMRATFLGPDGRERPRSWDRGESALASPATARRYHPSPSHLRARRRDAERGRAAGRAAARGGGRLQDRQAALPARGSRGRPHGPPARRGGLPRLEVPRHPAHRRPGGCRGGAPRGPLLRPARVRQLRDDGAHARGGGARLPPRGAPAPEDPRRHGAHEPRDERSA